MVNFTKIPGIARKSRYMWPWRRKSKSKVFK